MTDARYGGYPEGTIDDVRFNRELVYQNTEDTSPGDDAAESVELANPRVFFVREPHKPRVVAERFVTRTIAVGTQPQLISGANRRRHVLKCFTDGGNTVPVFIGDNHTNGTGLAGDTSMGLFPNSQPFIMQHTGAVYAFATAPSILYVYEETYE
jgi:hypothetical protein